MTSVGHALERDRRATQQAALASAAAAVHASLDLDQVLATLCEAMAHAFGADVAIASVADDCDGYAAIAAHGLPSTFVGLSRELDEGLSGRAIATNAPALSNAYEHEGHAALRGVHSGVAVPVGSPLGVDGALEVAFRRERPVGELDAELLGDGSLVRVGELSDLEIDKLDVDAANQPTTSRFNLASGQARAWVARQVVAKVGTGMGRFAVQTPTAVAAVRQTDFALANERVYTFAGVVETRSTDPSVTGFVLCGRNRYTDVKKLQCQIIPLSEKRKLLAPNGLAVEGVFLEPNNLDNVASGVLVGKHITELMTGTWSAVGPARPAGSRAPRTRAAPSATST